MSAVVVARDDAATVGACLDALLGQRGLDLEVVVVDRGSADATPAVVEAYAGRVRLLRLSDDPGYGAATAAGVAAAAHRHLWLVGADHAPAADCGRLLLAHLTAVGGCGAAAADVAGRPPGHPEIGLRAALSGACVVLPVAGPSTVPTSALDRPAAACVVVDRVVTGDAPMPADLPPPYAGAALWRSLRARGYRCEVVGGASARALGPAVGGLDRADAVAALRRYVGPAWTGPRLVLLTAVLLLDALLALVRPSTRPAGRATLGALGLPGGTPPTTVVLPTRAVRLRGAWWRVKGWPLRAYGQAGRRRRRRRFLRRVRWQAWLVRSSVAVDVDRGADLAAGVRVEVHPGTVGSLVIGPGSRLEDGVVLRIGGRCRLGPLTHLRYGVILNAKGSLTLEARNVLGRGSMVHADGDLVWGWGASCAEYVSVLDSHHAMDGSLIHVHDHPVTQQRTALGACSLVGAHSTVLPGVTVGAGALVGSGSVVSKDVPAGVVAAGVPARVLGGPGQTPRSARE